MGPNRYYDPATPFCSARAFRYATVGSSVQEQPHMDLPNQQERKERFCGTTKIYISGGADEGFRSVYTLGSTWTRWLVSLE